MTWSAFDPMTPHSDRNDGPLPGPKCGRVRVWSVRQRRVVAVGNLVRREPFLVVVVVDHREVRTFSLLSYRFSAD